MVENSKQVRVDNWGIFFLQRLQMFFSKTDYCDLTLQFEGNVQLKVHRLVMNACTEYFQFLEQAFLNLEENVIVMPPDLQADVIVPIVNFMYTGMLEFHVSLYDKLYKAADLMNITVLTKLLDAQKTPRPKTLSKKLPPTLTAPTKKTPAKPIDLPATLPGRKLPVWKRKSAPSSLSPHLPTFQECRSTPPDPLSLPDNTPKPARFEWPEDDLPTLNLMENSFEDISYNSKPLLTKDEELRASSSFDDIKNIPNSNLSTIDKKSSPTVDIEDVKDYVKEQKIRSDLVNIDGDLDLDLEVDGETLTSRKRRLSDRASKLSPKRAKNVEKENKETTINISAKAGVDFDHEKIVAEILKKYPQLVKKNKNIRLKIMTTGGSKTGNSEDLKSNKTPRMKVQVAAIQNRKPMSSGQPDKKEESLKESDEGPWTCTKCPELSEFLLYYLYRKHMIDAHNEKFNDDLCKYCGHKCKSHQLLIYHLYTKHALKLANNNFDFPKCDRCPFIAISDLHLHKHQQIHDDNEVQCSFCDLAFNSQVSLNKHLQVSGHLSKDPKASIDCQYCNKWFSTSVNLFFHIKIQHATDAKRDGIVSIDEGDDAEHFDNEGDGEVEGEGEDDEYIVPEIIPEVTPRDTKVKIISDVKVPQGPLEPSSEAEALNNVASGIATSLGLVDIVVLDDNQQYILQQQQDNSGQPEFILPGENPFTSQVITSQHNSVIPTNITSDIASTDELVMVLTDHDYNDAENADCASNNSNIVVLYSHPVDGQQGQFITSQGNLMVNSQTGLLELHNASSEGHLVVNDQQDTQIESIEMIQREIDSHTEIKPEPNYEESTEKNEVTESETVAKEKTAPLDESVIFNEINEGAEEELEKTNDNIECEEDQVDGSSELPEQAMDVDDEIHEQTLDNNYEKDEPVPEESLERRDEQIEEPTTSEEGLDVLPEPTKQPPTMAPEETPEPTPENQLENSEEYVPEPMEVDGKLAVENNTEEGDSTRLPILETEEKAPPEEVSQSTSESQQDECLQSETSRSQFNDENSQSSQGSEDKNHTAKVSILDDWDDTDSQQSEQPQLQQEEIRPDEKEAEETVNKLMDDWDEEDEDESKKAVGGE